MKKNLACIVIIVSMIACKKEMPPSFEGVSSDAIRLNQIGYYPNSIKKAVVVDSTVRSEFKIVNKMTMETVFSGTLSETIPWELAGEKVKIADFSKVTQEGEYLIYIAGVGYSYPFEIKNNVLREVFVASIKAMYYQRASMPLEEQYAGKWHRPMGHSDDSVRYHPSSGKKEGFRISPKGWYDAGDYNKYVVNGSFPLGQFYLLQEHYGNIIKDNQLNIPESGNGISDYLDELKYEMDWLLTMQDDDGGLFHKLTTKNFEGMVMPHEATAQR